jgi:pimeloyl-ACP methyl ester carboxylesterase
VTKLPLLLIPGLNCTATLWLPQIDALGAGRAVMVADPAAGEGTPSMRSIAAAILAEAPPRFALAGLSMGGYLAFEILRQAPGRVDRLALIDTQARPESAEAREARLGVMEVARKGGFARVPALQMPKLLTPAHQQAPRLVAIVHRMAAATGLQAFLRQQVAVLERPDSRPDLAGISIPTLILVGDQDLITPVDAAREMHQGIAGSRFAIVPDSGHLSPIEAPDAVNAAMADWLEG